MENSLANKKPWLVAEWSERNGSISPDDVPYGSKKLYWWHGSCGHLRGLCLERRKEAKTMSVSTDTERIFRIGGYVKRAKLNLRNEREIRAFHRNAIERRFGDFEDGTLVDVYIDITGYKETAKRPEMLRLMRDCADGNV